MVYRHKPEGNTANQDDDPPPPRPENDCPIGGEGTDILGGPAIRSQLFSRNLAILLFAKVVSVTGWFAVVTGWRHPWP